MNKQTGELEEAAGKLHEVIYIEKRREDGSLYIAQDFSNCPSMAEQHTAHLTDLNYLIKKFKPDDLAQYLAARQQYRNEIVGHDFSEEPSLQEAKNVVYKMKTAFEALPDDIKYQFKNHVEFLKFIDNPANAEKMIKLGLLKPKQIQELTQTSKNDDPNNDKNQLKQKTTTAKGSEAT